MDRNEGSITNIINEFFISAKLPCHIVDEVYVLINYDDECHWVLVLIVLKERFIWVYDSLLGIRKRDPSNEIHKLTVMLPTYLSDNEFFLKDKTY